VVLQRGNTESGKAGRINFARLSVPRSWGIVLVGRQVFLRGRDISMVRRFNLSFVELGLNLNVNQSYNIGLRGLDLIAPAVQH
jgi:hypothetical protein